MTTKGLRLLIPVSLSDIQTKDIVAFLSYISNNAHFLKMYITD